MTQSLLRFVRFSAQNRVPLRQLEYVGAGLWASAGAGSRRCSLGHNAVSHPPVGQEGGPVAFQLFQLYAALRSAPGVVCERVKSWRFSGQGLDSPLDLSEDEIVDVVAWRGHHATLGHVFGGDLADHPGLARGL